MAPNSINTNELPQLLSITAVAEYLGVDVRHVRRLVADHLLRFDPTEITDWIG